MNNFLPRQPAHVDFTFDVAHYTNASDAQSSFISEVLKKEGVLKKKEPVNDEIIGDYHLITQQKDYFIKVLFHKEYTRQKKALDLLDYLNDEKYYLPVKQIEKTSSFIILCYPWIPHRFASTKKEDIKKIGFLVAHCHQLLKNYPKVSDSQAKTKMHYAALSTVDLSQTPMLEKFLQDRRWQEAQPVLLPNVLLLNKQQQTHGDINYGNIIFSNKDDKPRLLDFEDSCFSYLSSAFDIAFVIERFILQLASEDKVLFLVQTFLESYQTVNPLPALEGQSFARLLQSINYRALLLLTLMEKKKHPVMVTEWGKFTQLFLNTLDNRQLMKAITACWERFQ